MCKLYVWLWKLLGIFVQACISLVRFAVRAKIDDVVIEITRLHQEIAYSVKEISPDLEKRIRQISGPYRQMGTNFGPLVARYL